MRLERQAHRGASREQRVRLFVEQEHRSGLAAPAHGGRELGRQRGLAGARGTDDQRARAFLDAAAEQGVELGETAGHLPSCRRLPMFGRDQAREHLDAALADDVVVVATAKLDTAVLHDPDPATLGPVLGVHLLEQDDPVRNALHLQVVLRWR